MENLVLLILLATAGQACDPQGVWTPAADQGQGWLRPMMGDRSISSSIGDVSTKLSGKWVINISTFSWEVTNEGSREIVVDLSGIVLEELVSPSQKRSIKVTSLRRHGWEGVYFGPGCECFSDKLARIGKGEEGYYATVPLRVGPGDSALFELEFAIGGRGGAALLKIPVTLSDRTLWYEYSFSSS